MTLKHSEYETCAMNARANLPAPTHTLCFLTSGEKVLMLYRRKEPNRGLWNGVGGRIEIGEAPHAACLREVHEETGLYLTAARFAGLLTWRGTAGVGALALYTAPAPSEAVSACDEGELRWHPKQWVIRSGSVVSNIHIFGTDVFNEAPPCVYHFNYGIHGEIQSYERQPLPASFHASKYDTDI